MLKGLALLHATGDRRPDLLTPSLTRFTVRLLCHQPIDDELEIRRRQAVQSRAPPLRL
jgi:hypothetical protein